MFPLALTRSRRLIIRSQRRLASRGWLPITSATRPTWPPHVAALLALNTRAVGVSNPAFTRPVFSLLSPSQPPARRSRLSFALAAHRLSPSSPSPSSLSSPPSLLPRLAIASIVSPIFFIFFIFFPLPLLCTWQCPWMVTQAAKRR